MANVAGTSRVLVVEGDPQITQVLRMAVTRRRYRVRTAADCRAGLVSLAEWHPGLVIVDVQMQRIDGLEVCQHIRAKSRVPLIVLSAIRDEATKVAAFALGADDYITKPFGTEEFLARVRAILRRSAGGWDVAASFSAGDIWVDFEAHRVRVRGTHVPLTPKEFELFVYMARRPHRVLSHRELLGAVWGESAQAQSGLLRVFMGQLRKKLETDQSQPEYLKTEPWVGYKFSPREPGSESRKQKCTGVQPVNSSTAQALST